MSFRQQSISAAWTQNDVDYPAQIRPNGGFVGSTAPYVNGAWITNRLGRFSRPKVIYGYSDLYNIPAIGTSSLATVALFEKAVNSGAPGLRYASLFTQDLKLAPRTTMNPLNIYLAADIDYYVGVIVDNVAITTEAIIYSCYGTDQPLIRKDTTFAYYQAVGYSYPTYNAPSSATDLSSVADGAMATHMPIVSLWVRNQ